MWEFARYSVFNGLFARTAGSFDRVILGSVVATGMVASYEVSAKAVSPSLLMTSVITAGLVARISNLYTHGEDVAPHVTRNLSFASLFSVPIFFGSLALGGRVLSTAFGSQYGDAAALLIWLALAKVIQTQATVLTSVIRGLDLPSIELGLSVVTNVVNIALGLVLVYTVGPVGVAVATAAAIGLRWVGALYIVHTRVSDATLITPQFGKQVVAGLAMFGLVTILNSNLMTSSWVSVVLTIGAGAVTYFTVLGVIWPEIRRATVRTLSQLLDTGASRVQ